MKRIALLAGLGFAGYRLYSKRQADASPASSPAAAAAAQAGDDVQLSSPDPKSAVMPDGAEANDGIGARTIGDPDKR